MIIRDATAEEWPAVEALLRACALPTDGARENLAHFVVCETDGIAGCAGAEVFGEAALLRSVAVRADARGSGIADKLTATVLARLEARKVATVAMLTTTAESYFAARGFVAVAREELPSSLNASTELKGTCPATAVAMLLRL